jgi:hypothetical protein
MDKQYLCDALERASGYLRGIQDADTWPEDEAAADLITELKNGVNLMEDWEAVVTINVRNLFSETGV